MAPLFFSLRNDLALFDKATVFFEQFFSICSIKIYFRDSRYRKLQRRYDCRLKLLKKTFGSIHQKGKVSSLLNIAQYHANYTLNKSNKHFLLSLEKPGARNIKDEIYVLQFVHHKIQNYYIIFQFLIACLDFFFSRVQIAKGPHLRRLDECVCKAL